MPRILVTGGAGFIGSHIVEAAVRDGHSVRVLDDLSTGKLCNLTGLLDRVEFVRGDVRNARAVREAADGVDAISHQAARISVPGSFADPIGYEQTNVEGTLNVLEAARQCGVKRVVLASTSAVYGDATEMPVSEATPTSPLSPYAASKLSAEVFCQMYANANGVGTTALRYFNVFGPRQDPGSEYAAVIPKFLSRMQAGRAPIIFGDGAQTRDFVYVGDVARINLLALFSPIPAFRVYNVASGETHSVLDMAIVLNEVMGTRFVPEFAPARQGDILHSSTRVDRAAEDLGFRAQVSLREGLSRMVTRPEPVTADEGFGIALGG